MSASLDNYAQAARICPAMGFVFLGIVWAMAAVTGLNTSDLIVEHGIIYWMAMGPVLVLGLVGIVCGRMSSKSGWPPLVANVLLVLVVVVRFLQR